MYSKETSAWERNSNGEKVHKMPQEESQLQLANGNHCSLLQVMHAGRNDQCYKQEMHHWRNIPHVKLRTLHWELQFDLIIIKACCDIIN